MEIYLDNNATTMMIPEVREAMQIVSVEQFGNASSSHAFGRRARAKLEDAREQIAALLGAHADELVFTSGATEANNLAIFGLCSEPPVHIVCSAIEHPSVTEPVNQLARHGCSVDWAPVNANGMTGSADVASLFRENTRLVTVQMVNHETGAIQPIREIAKHIPTSTSFHCDAVQAVGKLLIRFHELGVTSLAASAHKFHGPKGIGLLLVRRNQQLTAQLWGGHQQQGRRPGTEPVTLAVGMAKALTIAHAEMADRRRTLLQLRQRFLDSLNARASPVVLNGPSETETDYYFPSTANVSFPGCRADSLLINLDLAGIACSTGSACSSGSLLPSPVLKAMQVPDDVLHSAMRFSFCHLLTEAEVDLATERIADVVARLRTCEAA